MKKKSSSDCDDAVAKEFNEFFNSIGQNTVEKIYSLANEFILREKTVSFRW